MSTEAQQKQQLEQSLWRTRKPRLEAARAALLGIVETFDDNIGDIFQDAA